jgi:hypothetical protein
MGAIGTKKMWERWSKKVFSKSYFFLGKLMIAISEIFTVESQLVPLKTKIMSLLIECRVDFI